MKAKTIPETWATEKPVVVFLVPAEGALTYVAVMNQLSLKVLGILGWAYDSLELYGMLAASAAHGKEEIYYLEENGIDTSRIALVMLWGDTAESVNFRLDITEGCGVGAIVLPRSGAILPTVRMPTIDGDWWYDAINQEHAATVYASLLVGGTDALDDPCPIVFVASPATWN